MEFWIFLFGIVAFFVVFPYIRCLVKRMICLRKIRQVCRKKQYTLYRTHPLWILGRKGGGICDCYIETPNEIFAVKLFGMPRRLTVLILKESGEYVIRSFLAILPFVRFTFHTKPRRMPDYDFRARYRDAWEIKTPHHILLVHPTSMEICRQPLRGAERIVGRGEVVNGMELYALSGFLGALECAL